MCEPLIAKSYRLAEFQKKQGANTIVTLANEASNIMGRGLGRQTLYLL